MIAALWNTVKHPGPSMFAYLLRVVPIVIIPALIIASIVGFLVQTLGVDAGYDQILNDDLPGFSPAMKTLFMAVTVIILAPFIETLMMAGVFWLLQRFKLSFSGLIIGQVLFWIVLHSLQAPVWGFTIAWAFFIFSVAYLSWQPTKGTNAAIIVVFLLHALNNAFFFGMTLLPGAGT